MIRDMYRCWRNTHRRIAYLPNLRVIVGRYVANDGYNVAKRIYYFE